MEAIIALFLISVGIVGFFSVFQKIINYNSIIFSRLTAAYLAQEGIEIVRNIRDSYWLDGEKDWEDFLDLSNSYCLLSGSGCQADYKSETFDFYSGEYLQIDYDGFYSYSAGTSTKFQRKITINSDPFNPDDPVEVIVEVSWSEKGQDYKTQVQENLYRWWTD